MKVTENFDIREFVPKAVWDKYGANCVWFVNPKLINLAQLHKDLLCEEYGANVSVTINSWHYGGNRQWSGLRTYHWIQEQLSKGRKTATLSQHLGGQANAIDNVCSIEGVRINAQEIDNFVKENQLLYMREGLTTIEGTRYSPTWTHMDCRYTGLEELLIVGA
jgi:hypothetical protein